MHIVVYNSKYARMTLNKVLNNFGHTYIFTYTNIAVFPSARK